MSGNVIVDDRLWETSQLGGEPITPIVVNNNLIDFTTKPGRLGDRIDGDASEGGAVEGHERGQDGRRRHASQIRVSSPSYGKVVLSGTIAAGPSRPSTPTP